jgi:cytochrome c553
MFKLKTTTYVLLWLILFQSFCAVANSLDYHSIDVEHLSEVHEHEIHDNPNFKAAVANTDTSNDTSHNPNDCHHCGHCHGTHAQGLEHSPNIPLDALTSNDSFYYLSRIIDAPFTQLLRPPRA